MLDGHIDLVIDSSQVFEIKCCYFQSIKELFSRGIKQTRKGLEDDSRQSTEGFASWKYANSIQT